MTDYNGDAYNYTDSPATGNVVIVTPPADFATDAELAAHTTLTTTAHGGIVPSTRQITINGVTHNLGADQAWTVSSSGGSLNMTVTSADNTGSTDATAQLAADIATAAAAGHRRLYLPAGTYKIQRTTAGNVLAIAADNFELFGDGPGKTILKWADNLTFSSSVDIITIAFSGAHQSIHDLTLNGGTGHTLNNSYPNGILFGEGSTHGHAYNLEITSMNGAGGAGVYCLGSYMSWNFKDINTTLGTAVSGAGAATITPPSMNGIYPGRRLIIGGPTEEIRVTSITATTFTATFAGAHASSATMQGYTQGRGYHVFERVHVHDCYQAHGIGVSAGAMVVRDCRIEHVGASSLQHGMYIQGGGCRIENNVIIGSGGYNIHAHKQFVDNDASGDVYVGNISLNPTIAHMVTNRVGATGINGEMPITGTGSSLNRFTTITGNVFRNTGQWQSGGIGLKGPTVAFVGNTLEDICNTDGGGWIDNPDGDGTQCIIANNVFKWTNPGTNATNYTGVRTLGGIVEGNYFDVGDADNVVCIRALSGSVIRGNRAVYRSGATGGRFLVVASSNTLVEGNSVETANTGIDLWTLGGTANVIRNNYFRCSAGAASVSLDDWTGVTATIAGNRLENYRINYTGDPTGVILSDNDMTGISNAGGYTPVYADAGLLMPFTLGSGAVTAGALMKVSSGAIVPTTTSDTVFLGAAASGTGSNPGAIIFVIGQVGRVMRVLCDAAWAAGHYAIVSTTAAGKVTDGGTSAPGSPASYGVFLDTGGAAGIARVLLVKTL